MILNSPAFHDGEAIPKKYSYRDRNVNPPLEIKGVPGVAESLALVMDDPDAVKPAGKVWDHWVVWNIDPDIGSIEEDSLPSGAVEGTTDYDEQKYGGPNPPDGLHRYRFRLFALDRKLDLPGSATKDDLEKAIEGHVIEKAELFGTYAPK